MTGLLHRFGDKPLILQVVNPPSGTAVAQGLTEELPNVVGMPLKAYLAVSQYCYQVFA